MYVSTPTGRCGPCCSTAAAGSTAMRAPSNSCVVRLSQSVTEYSAIIPRECGASSNHKSRPMFTGSAAFAGDGESLWSARIHLIRSFPMPALTRRAFTGLALSALAAPAYAQQLDKVSFGTNWVAEAEHGGFYQALADGTYKKYGLDVTIVPGGPQVNNRMLLLASKIDFFMKIGRAHV